MNKIKKELVFGVDLTESSFKEAQRYLAEYSSIEFQERGSKRNENEEKKRETEVI